MGANFRFFLALCHMTFKSASMQRGAMLLRAFFSITTHLIYIPVWYILFQFTPNIDGWTIEHALYAYGLAIGCWGIVSLLAFGLRTLPEQIDHGELDAYLTLPKPVLLSAAISSSRNTGLGELLFGISLLIFCHLHYGASIILVPYFLLLGSVVFASAVLFFATFGFWLRQFLASAEEIYFNFNLMASRPAPIFTGLFHILSLTLLPVGLMTHIPVEYVMGHKIELLFYSSLGTVAYAAFAILFFHIGLRYYESGNRFGVRG